MAVDVICKKGLFTLTKRNGTKRNETKPNRDIPCNYRMSWIQLIQIAPQFHGYSIDELQTVFDPFHSSSPRFPPN